MKCPIHPTEELVERDGKFGKFSSHKYEGEWCNGKPPKESPNAVQSQALDLILNKLIRIETRLDKMATFLSGQVETKPATKEELGKVPF